jgi:hypothetical protein
VKKIIIPAIAIVLGSLICCACYCMMTLMAIRFAAVHPNGPRVFMCLSGGIGLFVTIASYQIAAVMNAYASRYGSMK